jgi:hypothetical protein
MKVHLRICPNECAGCEILQWRRSVLIERLEKWARSASPALGIASV